VIEDRTNLSQIYAPAYGSYFVFVPKFLRAGLNFAFCSISAQVLIVAQKSKTPALSIFFSFLCSLCGNTYEKQHLCLQQAGKKCKPSLKDV